MSSYKPKKHSGRSEPVIVGQLIEGLISASNAASVLVHHLQDPRFMDVRTTLDLTIHMCRKICTSSLKYGAPEAKTIVGYRKPDSGKLII